jgi:starch-binding outer membrane protein, SusD/RagB family
MKSMKCRILLTLLAITAAGCEDILDTVPNDRISPQIFWQTEADAILGANAVYTPLLESARHYASWDGMTDIGYTHIPQSPESFILQGTQDALNGRIAQDWSDAYAGIRTANTFMENVDNVETDNTALIDRLKGEVRALRAYYYMRLALLYGDVPLVTTVLTLDESKNLTRTPVGQVWDFISNELDAAAALLPVSQDDVGRITKGAALGLKARAMLYDGRYQEAADAASAVMSLGAYSLYPSYKDLFTYPAENNDEVIMDAQFVGSSLSNDIFNVLAQRSQNASSLYVPTKNLVDAYQMTNGLDITDGASGFDPYDPYTNRDPRLSYTVYVPGDVLSDGSIFDSTPTSTTGDAVGSTFVVSPTGFNVKKYVNDSDLADPANCGINYILLRYAEILLTYAEAKVELNSIDNGVYDAINAIRERPDVAMPAITPGKTQAELRDIIRHERLVELAFEGQRYFDIRRWQIAGDVMPGKVYGMTFENTTGDLETVEVTAWENFWNDRNYLWPVPQAERELNSDLMQNPNY